MGTPQKLEIAILNGLSAASGKPGDEVVRIIAAHVRDYFAQNLSVLMMTAESTKEIDRLKLLSKKVSNEVNHG